MLPDPVECENGGKRTFLQINGSRKRTTENVFTPVLARGIRELRAGKFFPRRMRFGVKFWGMIIVSGSVVGPIRRLTVLGGVGVEVQGLLTFFCFVPSGPESIFDSWHFTWIFSEDRRKLYSFAPY